MARARTIKPGFFENEQLAECSESARLLFVATWMLADRNGYLEDRPKRIKRFAFGYDDTNVEPLIDELVNAGFLVREAAQDGLPWLFVANFKAHQSPHQNEPARYNSDTTIRALSDLSENAVIGNRETEEGKQKKGNRKRGDIDDATRAWFLDAFWPIYPLKTARHAALLSAAKIPAEEREAVVAALRDQLTWPADLTCGLNPKRDKLPHASTWLNQRRWEDERPPARVDPRRQPGGGGGSLSGMDYSKGFDDV